MGRSPALIRRLLVALTLLLLFGCPADEPDGGVQLRSAAILVQTGEADEPDGGDRGDAPPPDLPVGRPVAGAPENAVIVQGHVEPSVFSEVRFDVPGTVGPVRVQVGTFVRKGETLAVLATDEREGRLEEARARLRDARAAAPGGSATRSGQPLPAWLEAEMEARLDEVEAQAAHAGADRAAFDRAARRGGDEEARDTAIRLATLRNGGSRRRSGVVARAGRERLAVALVEDLASRVRHLEDAIDSSTLKAPASGQVVTINVYEGGQWATRSVDPAFEILDPESHVVRAAVPTGLAKVMRPEEEVWIDLMDGSATAPGRTREVIDGELRLTGDDGQPVRLMEVIFEVPPAVSKAMEVGQPVRVAIRR
jgi:multidrug resistance efflux pump